ncbi:S46 family peptidase [Sphingomonas bacterium]|uniref:S46 family peptidase n=1 Tax=Sphingomonas bacterium TaxID=1895847 RepID=UPI0015776B28|nr:S46 family peptidase [Sphingomonas bacterium]
MKTKLPVTVLLAGAALLPLTGARADEGMWTFDAFPSAKVAKAYGVSPSQQWLDHVRLSALRLTGGCSSSLVSDAGLVLTNHHCVRDCAQALSSGPADYIANGFLAEAIADEKKCPGQQAEIVTAITDVTPRVQQAVGSLAGVALAKARDAATATIEKEGCTDPAKERCQVVTLFGGGQYKLYKYRKYSDVRLVYAPEADAAFFGGDPDNFNFPRYDLDAAFLRIYENGKPVATPNHLAWAARAPKEGELVFVAGNPGSTQRLYTQAQFAMLRDVGLPATELYFAELRGRLLAAMATDPEKARTGSDFLFGIENSYKALYGEWQALLDPAFSARLAANERDLRAKVAADPAAAARIGDPWGDVAKAQAVYRDFYKPYTFLEARAGLGSDLYGYARVLVRAAQERSKPDAERLRGFNDSALPLIEKQLVDPRPIYPWLEEVTVAYWLSKTREALTTDAPAVKALLGKESPEQVAHRLITGTSLADPAVRKALFEGGLPAIQASKDPLIQYVLAHSADGRALVDRYRFEVQSPTIAAQSKIAQARFAAYGTDLYPDATFTLRLSYGTVKGWTYQGVVVPPTTQFAGMFDRATGVDPFKLPPKVLAARSRIDMAKTVDFTSDNDIIGGNSGSPIMDKDGAVIGAIFDGNIHSLGGAFGFDPVLNRSVAVSTVAVEEALGKIYPGKRLLAELHQR